MLSVSSAASRARAAAFAAGTVWCAALAHVAAGGGVPGAGTLVAIGALAAGLGALLGWLSAWRLLLAVVMTGGQIFLHELFRYWSAYESGTLADHAGHAGYPGPGAGNVIEHGPGAVLAMPLWHAGCGLFLLLALVHGETLVRRLLSWLLPGLPGAPSRIALPEAGPCPVAHSWWPHERLDRTAHAPRGPPVPAAS
mgnify:CR=1 FL=1